MEDDEDDWAPDTVEWMDGTKTSLQPSENQAPAPIERQESPSKSESDEPKQDSDSATTPTAGIGPGKTILRPGARVSQSLTKPGLVLKSVPESPAPAPKPTANGSARSPWAPLPPVDKVSPVAFNPPAPPPVSQPPSGLRRESSTTTPQDSKFSLTSPTREIATDTFDRSWRSQDRSAGSRELFDAKSGRYEPAKGGRRTSFRQDNSGGFRPPSLLQRPSQAEQDRSFASQDVRNTERRTSSISINDHSSVDRRSSTEVTVDDFRVTDRVKSPHVAKDSASPLQSAVSDTSHAEVNGGSRPYAAYSSDVNGPGPSVDGNSDVHMHQQSLMRQRIEANRRRKQEEQEREEAAKQERIKQRLQALDATSVIEAPRPDIAATDLPPPATKPPEDANEKFILGPTEDKRLDVSSPAITSRPSQSTEQPAHLDGLGEGPSVYTSISRVHPATQPTSIKTSSSPSRPLSPLPSTNVPHPSHTQHHSHLAQAQLLPAHSDTSKLSSSDNNLHLPSSQPSGSPAFHHSPQHWAPATVSYPSASWSTHSGTHQGTPVWGPPSFDSTDIHRLPKLGYSQNHFRNSPQPHPAGPIAPPSVSPRPPFSTTRSEITHSPVSNMSPPTEVLQSPTTNQFNVTFNGRGAGASNAAQPPSSGPKRSAFIPGLGRYDGGRGANGGSANMRSNLPGNTSAWSNFAANVQADEAKSRAAKAAAAANAEPVEINRGYTLEFSQVNGGEGHVSRNTSTQVSKAIVNDTKPAEDELLQPMNGPSAVGMGPSYRQSRFFPGSQSLSVPEPDEINQAVNIDQVGGLDVVGDVVPSEKQPFIEPPEPEAEATLFGGSVAPAGVNVLVNLPKPRPTVKLPDKSVAPQLPPLKTDIEYFMAQRNSNVGFQPSQPIVRNIEWQLRFNSLFNDEEKPSEITNAGQAFDLTPNPLPTTSESKPIGTEQEFGPQICLPITWSSPISITLPYKNAGLNLQDPETKSSGNHMFVDPAKGTQPQVALVEPSNDDTNDETLSQSSDRVKTKPTEPVQPMSARPLSPDQVQKNFEITMNIASRISAKNVPQAKKAQANGYKLPSERSVPAQGNGPNGPSGGSRPNELKASSSTEHTAAPRKNAWPKPPKGNNGPTRRW